ncbi:MAG: HAD hydrolase-like protein [Candidatus Aegiribacteria sp.]|nr:HAD hydrolase-like protein [Candidatus Aegiribacteria sp.]
MNCKTLLILDADDTLWESALFFERTEYDFLELMYTLGFKRENIRHMVHTRDIERLSATGYGARPYINTLRNILFELIPEPPLWASTALHDIESTLLEHPVILMPGVMETLLAVKSLPVTTIIYTMGEQEHQYDKFMKSDLVKLVDDLIIVPEKTAANLEDLITRFNMTPDGCILVGNSPRSDINPALTLGIQAVHIIRDRTWAAEREDFINPGLVITIEKFDELLDIPGLIKS